MYFFLDDKGVCFSVRMVVTVGFMLLSLPDLTSTTSSACLSPAPPLPPSEALTGRGGGTGEGWSPAGRRREKQQEKEKKKRRARCSNLALAAGGSSLPVGLAPHAERVFPSSSIRTDCGFSSLFFFVCLFFLFGLHQKRPSPPGSRSAPRSAALLFQIDQRKGRVH